MALTVEDLQNATPTDWSKVDERMTMRSDENQNRFALDHTLYVKFFMHPRKNDEKSEAAGRPIYEDTEYIEIMMPGEKNNIIQRPAWSQDYSRFRNQYALFKAGQTEQETGTPLNALPFMTDSLIEELKYFKIHTVEKLANLNDAAMQNFMGAREYQQKAQKFLAALSSGEALVQKNQDLEAKLAAQQAQINDLMAMMAKQTEPEQPQPDSKTLHVKKA